MSVFRVIFILLLFLSAGVSMHLALLLGRKRGIVPGLGYMAFLLAATAWWSFLNGLEHLASSFSLRFLFSNLQWGAIVSIPVLWYIVSATLLLDGRPWSSRPAALKVGIWLIPAITLALALLEGDLGFFRRAIAPGDFHGLSVIKKEFGPWFYVHVAYSYGLILLGTATFVRSFRRGTGTRRKQGLLLAAAVFVPWAVNALHVVLGLPPTGVDPTPLAFTLSGALLIYNFWIFKFLTAMPGAQAAAANQIGEGVVILDARDRLVYVNPAACGILGLSPLMTGMSLGEIAVSRPTAALLPLLPGQERDIEADPGGRRGVYEARCERTASGGRAISRIITLHDITRRSVAEGDLRRANTDLESRISLRTDELEKANTELIQELERRRQIEHQLFYYSLHDPLTGLPNRSLLLNRLERGIARCKRDGRKPLSLLYVDFDEFKQVNDSYGHSTGDAFLREAARRLGACAGPSDMVARLGSDEFALLLEEGGGQAEAQETAERVSAELSVPFHHGKAAISPSASIGILTVYDPNAHPDDILRDADIAMHHAKESGKNRRAVFESAMRAAVQERARMVDALKRAIVSNALALNFQPIVSMSDRALSGCEALCRWTDPEFGEVSPDRFIPLAEDSSLIVPLGTYVLMEACKAAAEFKAGMPAGKDFYVAVNVSALQLFESDFAELLLSTLKRFGLSSRDIHLEITESSIIQNVEAVMPVVERLTMEGVPIKLDDFGTGYSSLGYLHRYPIGCVKIDKGFIADLSVELEGQGLGAAADGLVNGIISLSHSLGMRVVAEGIEDERQSTLLRDYGCDFGQGFLYGRPMDKAAMGEALRLDASEKARL